MKIGIRVIVIVSIFLWSHLTWSDAEQRADPDNKELTALGAQVYVEHCAVCHGKNLEGEPNWRTPKADGTLPAPPHDPSGHTWHHSDDVLFKLTKFGLSAFIGKEYPTSMPIYNEVLTDEEIWAVLAYIKSTWPMQIKEAQQRAR